MKIKKLHFLLNFTKVVGVIALTAFSLFFSSSSFAQTTSSNVETPLSKDPIVRGQVVNKSEGPVPGAAILVKGTTTGTASDMNGFFELNLSIFTEKTITLVITYYDSTSIEVDVKIAKLPKDLGQIQFDK
ncbi:carboxypeptidase-like regulatory domain-containing protein [Algoriphagus persicinus]|uniref:carboxypeptidase-like regulatory domain-containing protein n=1 Tax=Algoriphagus persicinus TaxID=3108754 RepID=UPI002B3F41B4|nr:carboxypeptidase-like regulatory domain-containing protein [Algoriphagus sp. E1-3-M2]MEB2784714.1 carboxypeptidase-like regulatory domain-containing protein [Algoriphagus sp. E1-3-M2]